jgi:hypothetical protein
MKAGGYLLSNAVLLGQLSTSELHRSLAMETETVHKAVLAFSSSTVWVIWAEG